LPPEAGPDRKEVMSQETMADVVTYAKRNCFKIIDVTGGAPEMIPGIDELIQNLSPLAERFMFRSNLSAINSNSRQYLIGLLKEQKAVIAASFPSINESQADTQRGTGIFEKSIAALLKLNRAGYGLPDTGLELNLVTNPTGAFFPQPQERTEQRFREVMDRKWGIQFNHLYSFANVPLGRFKSWLVNSDNYDNYMEKLSSAFNPCAVNGLMCRSGVSVSWDGYIYDCDFNLAAGLPLGGKKIRISEMSGPPETGKPILVSDYCYTCTAGAGFT